VDFYFIADYRRKLLRATEDSSNLIEDGFLRHCEIAFNNTSAGIWVSAATKEARDLAYIYSPAAAQRNAHLFR